MQVRPRDIQKSTDEKFNVNTSLLIALAVIGAAVTGAIELFALRAESETSQIVIRITGLFVFGAIGYVAARRARRLQQRVTLEMMKRDRALEQLRSAEDYNHLLVENGQGLLCVHDLRGTLLSVNRSAADMLGYSQQKLTRTSLRELLPEMLREEFDQYLLRIRSKGKDHGCMIIRAKNGALMTWAYRNSLFTRPNGEQLVVGTAQDITDQARREVAEKQTRTELEQANNRLKEQTARLKTYNQLLAHLHELNHSMQAGKTIGEAMALGLHPLTNLFVDCQVGIYVKDPQSNLFSKAAASGRLLMKSVLSPSECSSLRDGRIRVIDPNCSTCLYSDRTSRFKGKAYTIPLLEDEEIIGMLVLESRTGNMPDEEILLSAADHLKMMLKSKMLQQRLTNESTRDQLTGLLNRRFMEETLKAAVARAKRTGDPLAVVMLDIDHFKRLNDTFGHQAGDEALRVVSRIIQKSIRAEDVACRFGGEEFVLIMPGATSAVASARAEFVRRSISQIDLNHVALGVKGVTISAGVASYSPRALNETMLISAADEALYTAKNSGRNRVVLHGMMTLPLDQREARVHLN